MKTLGEFIVEKQHEFSHATGELTALLSAIKLGAKIIHRDINKAGLVDILGASGAENVQGEVQQKLDFQLVGCRHLSLRGLRALRCV